MDVSVIMMLYNQEKLVSRAIDSVLSQQTSYTFEIVVGDDCSSDGTRQIVEEYQSKYPDIVKLNEPHPNLGIIRNYHYCLSRCRGEFLMGCSGDDWWDNPHKIQIQVDYMKSHSDCVLHYGGFNEYYPATHKTIQKLPIKTTEPLFESVLRCNPVCALTACVRMSAMKKIGFEEFVKHGFWVEDWPKWLGLSLIGSFGISDEPLATYSIYEGSAHNSKNYETRLGYIDNFHEMRKYFVAKAGKEDELKDFLEDIYYNQKGETAIKYGVRKDAIMSFRAIHKKNKKVLVKTLLCQIPFLFNVLSRRYNKGI